MPNIIEPISRKTDITNSVYFRAKANVGLQSIAQFRVQARQSLNATVTFNKYHADVSATVNFHRPTLRFLPATVTFNTTRAVIPASINVKYRANLSAAVRFSNGGILRARVVFNRFALLPAHVYIGKRGNSNLKATVFLGTFHKAILSKVIFRRTLVADFSAQLTIGAPTRTAH